MNHTQHPPFARPGIALFLASLLSSATPSPAESPAGAAQRSIRVELPGQQHNAIKNSWPGISCWFMTPPDFEPDGFKRFIDLHSTHSGAGLLTTSIRHNVEVTQPAVHDQIKRAAEYARDHGLGVVMDLDIRLAREAFMTKYPDEMQELVRLREVPLGTSGDATLQIPSIELSDHYTPGARGVRPYGTLSARLLAAYSAVEGPDGIAPSTIRDISSRCRILQADTARLHVSIPTLPEDAGRKAFILASFTLFSPDVFAPHLAGFEKGILKQYADAPLAGACKDEWGFPGRFNPRLDDLYFSRAMAAEYAKRRPGRDLARDLLLMVKPHEGMAGERNAAINHYMEMNWQRNASVENAFYASIKEVFGSRAMAATHPTWLHYPASREEVFKNGLHWWAARRDLAQTDEATPFCVRTALAKKWHSPIWVNMFYDTEIPSYNEDLWRHALGGGRMNFHPVYPPPPNPAPDHLTTSLLHGRLMAADARIRLLNYISTAPIDCPVAIIFGHPAALNWAGSGLADVGMKIADQLWEQGCYADLIPSSEITAGNLSLTPDGTLQYGPQRYAAALLYHPQFEHPATADFLQKTSARAKTTLFRTGDWTSDFEGRPFPAESKLAQIRTLPAEAAAGEIIARLNSSGIPPQTRSTMRAWRYSGSMMPEPSGQCRLLDGTVILASGARDVMGDPIQKTLQIAGHPVRFDAVGIAAIRLDKSGKVEALAAGALRSLSAGDLQIELPSPVDLALWHDPHGHWQGVLQGCDGPIPEPLARITTHWTRLRLPAPVDQSPR